MHQSGQLAQSVRAPASHAGGRWFESIIAHRKRPFLKMKMAVFEATGQPASLKKLKV